MLKKIWNMLMFICDSAGTIACLIAGGVIILQVLSRLILGIAFPWVEEVAQLCLILIVFLCIPGVEKNNHHLTLEVVFSIFPRAEFYLQLLGKAIMVVYASFVGYSSIRMLPAVRYITAPGSGIPIVIIYIAMVFSCVLWIIQTIINIRLLIKNRREER